MKRPLGKPEESAEWEEQHLGYQPRQAASYQIFSWDNKMDQRGDGSSLPCTEGFTSGLYPKCKEEGRNKDHPWAQNKHKIKKGLGLPSVAPGKSPGCAEMPLIQSSTSVVIHAAAPSDSTIRKKEYEKLQKYQGLRKEHQQMWRVKTKMIGAVGSLTPKLSEWLQQEQHLGSLSG